MAHCRSYPRSHDVHFVMLTLKIQVPLVIRGYVSVLRGASTSYPTTAEAATHAQYVGRAVPLTHLTISTQ
jgi:hypothetical protein